MIDDDRPPRERRSWHRDLIVATIAGLVVLVLTVPVNEGWSAFSHRDDPTPLSSAEAEMQRELRLVEALRPGGREVDVASVLGVRASEQSRDGALRRTVYMLENAAVLTVADAQGKVLLTSVTALNRQFRPKFRMDDGSEVVLWETVPSDVQKRPALAIGYVGANRAFYYEWTGAPTHASNYRRGLYGYNFMPDEVSADGEFSLFVPFLEGEKPSDFGASSMQLPFDLAEARTRPSDYVGRWMEGDKAEVFRRTLLINTVGFQAKDVDAIDTYPAPDESEVWPHLTARVDPSRAS